MHVLWHRFTETRIFSEGEEPEVACSSFTNTWPTLISNGSITIYVPRAFQRAAPHPLILQHIQKAQLLVRLERFGTLSDIRICSSSVIVHCFPTHSDMNFLDFSFQSGNFSSTKVNIW